MIGPCLVKQPTEDSALSRQEGGNHYKDMKIQVVEFCHANGIGYMEGNIIKYACRYKKKGTPLTDLKKIIHYAELLIEMEEKEMGITPTG